MREKGRVFPLKDTPRIPSRFGREDRPPNDWRRVSALRKGALGGRKSCGGAKPAGSGCVSKVYIVRGRSGRDNASAGRGGRDFSRDEISEGPGRRCLTSGSDFMEWKLRPWFLPSVLSSLRSCSSLFLTSTSRSALDGREEDGDGRRLEGAVEGEPVFCKLDSEGVDACLPDTRYDSGGGGARGSSSVLSRD